MSDLEDDFEAFFNPRGVAKKIVASLDAGPSNGHSEEEKKVKENQIFQEITTNSGKRKIDVAGSVGYRIKKEEDPLYNPTPKKRNLGTGYAKEYRQKENDLIMEVGIFFLCFR
jgi:hypothetical protein